MFRDRFDAGRQLAERLAGLVSRAPVVVGMVRGGIPVAAVVAERLGAPLEVLVVRKVGVPWQPELGVGAVAEEGVEIFNAGLMADLGLTREGLESTVVRERALLAERVQRYRGPRPPADIRDRQVVLVDDGLATGITARAAIETLRRRRAGSVVLAVPVAAPDTARALRAVADQVVVVEQPSGLYAIGQAYAVFDQTSDGEVVRLLAEASARMGGPPATPTAPDV